eukprot:421948-Lingulodinium_polyedra.AAC.1
MSAECRRSSRMEACSNSVGLHARSSRNIRAVPQGNLAGGKIVCSTPRAPQEGGTARGRRCARVRLDGRV